MSSSSSRLRLTVLSPTPFWPSSNSWKLQGTFTPKPVVAATLHHCHSFPYSAFSFQSYIPRVPWLQAPSSNFSAVASLFCFCTYMLPSCTNEAEVLDIFMVWPWKSHNIPSLIVYWWRQSKKNLPQRRLQMTNRYMKKHLASLIREMQIKATVRYRLTL